MLIKAIIFDLDGTIIDTKEIWQQATGEILKNRGFNLTKAESQILESNLCGVGINDSCSLLKRTFNLRDSVKTLVEEKLNRACQLYKQDIKFIPGFKLFHKKISKKNLLYSIATNSERTTLNYAKKQLNLEQFFGQHIYDVECVNNILKPNPAIYLHAAQKLNVDPKHCLAIEDSPSGIKAAKQAGMICIGIDTNNMGQKLNEADFIVNSYEEIDLKIFFKEK
ncbi:HAD family phosphatase [bacterium]|nr:HAD family phosphatase [bacterium]